MFRTAAKWLLLLIPCFGLALPADRHEIMRFRADSADLNQTSHVGIYKGHVCLDQGTTHIRAALARTEGNEKNQLMRAIIQGNQTEQAHYWTLTASDKKPVHAFADTIYYYPNRPLIELIGHAKVLQGEDSFTAPTISYDTVHQHILSTSTSLAQTSIIFHPGGTP